jgi:predicted ester cyclase
VGWSPRAPRAPASSCGERPTGYGERSARIIKTHAGSRIRLPASRPTERGQGLAGSDETGSSPACTLARGAETARRLVEAFNAHDRCAIRALNAPGAIFEGPGGIRAEGRDAAAGAYVVTLLDGFPDATMTIRNQFGSGPWVVQEFTFQGTHASPVEGPDGTIATTGRRVTGSGIQIGRYERGHVSQIRVYYDRVDVLGQLGVSPAADGDRVLRRCNRSSSGSPDPLMAPLPRAKTGS